LVYACGLPGLESYCRGSGKERSTLKGKFDPDGGKLGMRTISGG
jgi:hypothetical protein